MLIDKESAIRTIQQQRDEAIRVAHAEYQRQLALIDLIWSERVSAAASIDSAGQQRPAGSATGELRSNVEFESLTKRVLKTVLKFDTEFTVDELMLALELSARGPNRNAVNTALARAIEDGVIARTQRGNRKQPAIYKVTAKGIEQAKKAGDGLLPMN